LDRETGEPVLTDFGVAMLRSTDPVRSELRLAFGTPHYMSPEQAAGELDIDGRSDLYALGVLGYTMLSGRVPFDGESFGAIAAQHLTVPPEPLSRVAPEAPPDLIAAIERCLAKETSARWRHGRDLHAALSQTNRRRVGGLLRRWIAAR
jgi:serine/threonine protein kinase